MPQNALMTLPSVSGSLTAPTLTTRTSTCSSGVDIRMPGSRVLSEYSHDGYLPGWTDILRIMPLSPIESDEVIFETSSDLELGDLTPEKLIMQPAPRNQSQRKKSNEPESSPRNKRKVSAPRRRAMVAAQLTPPLTLASRRNTSKNTATKNGGEVRVTVANTDGVFTQVAGSPRSFNTRKGLVPKRKPKRPLVSLRQNSLLATRLTDASNYLRLLRQAYLQPK